MADIFSSENSTAPKSPHARAIRWALGVGAAVGGAVGLVLLFLLTQATGNHTVYENYYGALLTINVALAVFLGLVLIWVAARLILRWRQEKFGSRLLLKLAGIFALVGALPGLLIYLVSYQFVARSIESWFDVQIEAALDAGVTLATTTLDTLSAELAHNARAAADELGAAGPAQAALQLERLREQLGATSAVLWNATAAGVVASAGPLGFVATRDRPSAAQLRAAAASTRALTSIEGLEEAQDYLDAQQNQNSAPESFENKNIPTVNVQILLSIYPAKLDLLADLRYLQLTVPLSPYLVENALAVQRAQREYQSRALARESLRRMYIGALTLSLFLAVFGAVLLAVILGNQLVHPLLVLARGVRDVSLGDLSPKAVLQTRDELGGLTRSFALMTQQLLDARTAADENMARAKSERARLQTILQHLTAGVWVLDQSWHLILSNPGAGRILKVDLENQIGQDIQDIQDIPTLRPLAEIIPRQFSILSAEHLENWQQVLEIQHEQDEKNAAKLTLVVRGARLPALENASQYLVVFDDISAVASAQRAQAWAEVARRVAHEIKNPLTPIQLAAQRLELKLTDKLTGADQALLTKSIKTIVEQVGAMLRLVNEFRDYARLPSADLKSVDLNALILDILPLYSSERNVGEDFHYFQTSENAASVAVVAQLDAACPPIAADAQQLRQVIHNLVQNAQDATAAQLASLENPENQPENPQTPSAKKAIFRRGCDETSAAQVEILTQWHSASQRVALIVRDSGGGFAPAILQRAFEPYVTTKARGTGLGLAVVKKIADEHHAAIVLANRSDGVHGAQVSLSFAPFGQSTQNPPT